MITATACLFPEIPDSIKAHCYFLSFIKYTLSAWGCKFCHWYFVFAAYIDTSQKCKISFYRYWRLCINPKFIYFSELLRFLTGFCFLFSFIRSLSLKRNSNTAWFAICPISKFSSYNVRFIIDFILSYPATCGNREIVNFLAGNCVASSVPALAKNFPAYRRGGSQSQPPGSNPPDRYLRRSAGKEDKKTAAAWLCWFPCRSGFVLAVFN